MDLQVPVILNQELLLWIDEATRRSVGGTSAYQYQVICRLKGTLDPAALQEALNLVVARHEALRAKFTVNPRYSARDRTMQRMFFNRTGLFVPGFFTQRIANEASVSLEVHTFVPESDEREEDWAQSRVRVEEFLTLRMHESPCLRAVVYCGAIRNTMVLTLSHLTVDLQSATLLVREIDSIYRTLRNGGSEPSGRPSESTYRAFIQRQTRMVALGGFVEEERFWKERWQSLSLKNKPASPNFPRTDGREGVIHVRRAALDEAERQALSDFTDRTSIEPSALFLAAFSAVWSQFTDSDFAALLVTFPNRMPVSDDGLIAPCCNRHVVCFSIQRQMAFLQFVATVAEELLAAGRFESLPPAALWLKLGHNYLAGKPRPAFEHRKACAPLHQVDIVLEQLRNPYAFVDFTCRLEEAHDRIVVVLVANASAYPAGVAERVLLQLRVLIRIVLSHPDWPVGRCLASC